MIFLGQKFVSKSFNKKSDFPPENQVLFKPRVFFSICLLGPRLRFRVYKKTPRHRLP
jgi:hypothetical protein